MQPSSCFLSSVSEAASLLLTMTSSDDIFSVSAGASLTLDSTLSSARESNELLRPTELELGRLIPEPIFLLLDIARDKLP